MQVKPQTRSGALLVFAMAIFTVFSLISVTILQWTVQSAGNAAGSLAEEQARLSLRSAAALFSASASGQVQEGWKENARWDDCLRDNGTLDDATLREILSGADYAAITAWREPPDIAMENPPREFSGENFILEVLRDMAEEHSRSASATARELTFPQQDGWPRQISAVTASLRMDDAGSFDLTATFSAPGTAPVTLLFQADTRQAVREFTVSDTLSGGTRTTALEASVIVWPDSGRTVLPPDSETA